jgi:hypothetical protein
LPGSVGFSGRIRDDRGTATTEFILVGALLTLLTLSVIQFGLTLFIRTTVLDAASEGARFGSLAGNSAQDGVDRTRALIDTAIGETYARDIRVGVASYRGRAATEITVRAPLPVVGLIGVAKGLEVTGHAAIEQFAAAR